VARTAALTTELQVPDRAKTVDRRHSVPRDKGTAY
jgi:hypothetical protein